MAWTHDVVVVGAGAAGLTAAGGCARLGLRVALIERERMGGECLHTGCVPSKALLAAARRAQAMRGDRLGIAGREPEIDFGAVRAHVAGAIAAIAPHDAPARFEAWGVEVIRGDAALTGPWTVRVGGRTLAAPRIVLATGSAPAVPPIPGLDGVAYLTNETVFGLETLPSHLLVLGGGAIGVELAQAFRRLGAAVTLVEQGALLAAHDEEAVALVRDALRAEGVRVLEGVRVEGASGSVRLLCAGGETLEGSHLLIATGRRARCEGLERAGVAVGADGIVVDRRRRTNVGSIYAIGDCRAGPRLTHAAGHDGRVVVAAIGFGLPSAVDEATLPTVSYTEPELAQVGLTEAAARARHGAVEVRLAAFADNDRAVTDGETVGWLKVIRARGRVVGVTIVGAGAGDLVLPWVQAMRRRAGLWALADAIVPYPTRSELSQAVASDFYEGVLFGRAARGWARTLAWIRARGR